MTSIVKDKLEVVWNYFQMFVKCSSKNRCISHYNREFITVSNESKIEQHVAMTQTSLCSLLKFIEEAFQKNQFQYHVLIKKASNFRFKNKTLCLRCYAQH